MELLRVLYCRLKVILSNLMAHKRPNRLEEGEFYDPTTNKFVKKSRHFAERKKELSKELPDTQVRMCNISINKKNEK